MRGLNVFIGLLLSLAGYGQQSAIGLTGGPSLCRLRGNNIFKQVDPVVGHQFGIHYSCWSKRGFGVDAQVNYLRMGGALDFIGLDQLGDEIYRDHIRYRIDHLGLALGASFRSQGRVHAQFQLGLMPSMVVAAEFRSPAGFNDPGDFVVTDLSAEVNDPVLFGYGAFGGSVDLKAPVAVGLMLHYTQGLTTLSRSNFFKDESILETSWTLALTLTYRWGDGG